MKSFVVDFCWDFVKKLRKEWLFILTGTGGLLWGFATLKFPQYESQYLFPYLLLCLVLGTFIVWFKERKMVLSYELAQLPKFSLQPSFHRFDTEVFESVYSNEVITDSAHVILEDLKRWKHELGDSYEEFSKGSKLGTIEDYEKFLKEADAFEDQFRDFIENVDGSFFINFTLKNESAIYDSEIVVNIFAPKDCWFYKNLEDIKKLPSYPNFPNKNSSEEADNTLRFMLYDAKEPNKEKWTKYSMYGSGLSVEIPKLHAGFGESILQTGVVFKSAKFESELEFKYEIASKNMKAISGSIIINTNKAKSGMFASSAFY